MEPLLQPRRSRRVFELPALVFVACASVLATLGVQKFIRPETANISTPCAHAELQARRGDEITNYTVIMTADPGTMVGKSEASVLIDAFGTTLRHAQHPMYCQQVLHGEMFGQPVLLVTTGIGHDHASICVSDLLRVFNNPQSDGTRIKDIFFIGTAGFSPRRGGLLNPDACDTALGAAEDDALITLGDVCVSPFSTNFDCQVCEWNELQDADEVLAGATICRAPNCSAHGKEDLFGAYQCEFFSHSTDLADEVLAAAKSGQDAWPAMPAKLQALQDQYWETNENSTGISYSKALRRRNVAHSYSTCSECTSNTFWAGAPYDQQCRRYIANLTNKAGIRQPDGRSTTAADTISVSAMEATGWMGVMGIRMAYMNFTQPIPFVNMRSAADYVMPPIKQFGHRWIHEFDWVNGVDKQDFTQLGYRHSINTVSSLMLDVLRFRN